MSPTTPARRVPLSVLDLAIVAEGTTGQDAIRESLDLAVLADTLGYRRFWFAEHHLAPGVASASPAVLAALAADRTRRIKVGSGAVLLSTTSPLVAAEQFGAIAALHPGRVDLGLGRSFTPPPTTTADAPAPVLPVRRDPQPARDVDGLHVPASPPVDRNDSALRERFLSHVRVIGAQRTAGDFRSELELVLGLRAGTFHDVDGQHHPSPPVQGADLDLWVLASSGGESARVAGELGLPLAANYHVSPSTALETVASYREAFRPGVLAEPYVVVSADVLVAETDARAAELADGFVEWVLSIRAGGGAAAYPAPGTTTPWDQRPDAQRDLVRDRVDTRFVGSPATVVERLEALQRVTGADELLVTTEAFAPADRERSFTLLAQAWGEDAGADVPVATDAREPVAAR
ncbi:LLM class flavin-dependent oxidoreductase [Cellulomonas biazotea]|uniref:Putative monooxygenase n=1 Tax=Cellulomonas biazotea TaxID=1709 RepID=A0A402DSA2_9CELL|nr:LLM class flavin-dependent oxidoreductase [Cellulomonas biazotea]GCE77019.1 putative monooxygenase [Cellulomonas biazotea]